MLEDRNLKCENRKWLEWKLADGSIPDTIPNWFHSRPRGWNSWPWKGHLREVWNPHRVNSSTEVIWWQLSRTPLAWNWLPAQTWVPPGDLLTLQRVGQVASGFGPTHPKDLASPWGLVPTTVQGDGPEGLHRWGWGVCHAWLCSWTRMLRAGNRGREHPEESERGTRLKATCELGLNTNKFLTLSTHWNDSQRYKLLFAEAL